MPNPPLAGGDSLDSPENALSTIKTEKYHIFKYLYKIAQKYIAIIIEKDYML